MRSGLDILTVYEKKFALNLPEDQREFLIDAVEAALKEVYELAQRDLMKVARKLAQQLKEEEEKDG